MAYKAPSVHKVVQETPDPVINMAETSAAIGNEKKKRGLLSTFMGNYAGNARSAGFLQNLINKQSTLGNQTTD